MMKLFRLIPGPQGRAISRNVRSSWLRLAPAVLIAAAVFLSGSLQASETDLDSAFLKQMAQASKATVELGHLAAHKSRTPQLSDLGRKLAREHQKLLGQIQGLAQAAGLELPSQPDLEDQLALQDLRQQSGKEFDQALATRLVAETAKSLKELEETTRHLQNPAIKHMAFHLDRKLDEEMAEVRDAAKDAGLSQGTILAIIQRQQAATAPE